MKVVAVVTEDFRFFYGAVRCLREREQSFISLGLQDRPPLNVELVLTTKAERKSIRFRRVIASDDPEMAVKEAMVLLKGSSYERIVVGVDPGPRPGIAFLGDGKRLMADTLPSPEAVGPAIQDLLSMVKYDQLLLRVGHGDRTNRDRVLNVMWNITRNIEVVDETSTTRHTECPDAEAAVTIARSHGELLPFRPVVEPKQGELRDIQRMSRIKSDGALTISTALAREVALGRLDMEEAIKKQKGEEVSEDDPGKRGHPSQDHALDTYGL